MSVITLRDGTRIHYELHGSGATLALTPGGRNGMDSLRPLALKIAQGGYCVLIYDRRNCGASDVVIERRWDATGAGLSEQEIFAEDMYEILGHLNARPCWVGGVSAGCRVSLLLAIRHPDAVKGLLVWMVTGGAVAAKRLGYNYYEQFMEVAERQGMEGVLRTAFFAERVQQNPSNRERLLRLDPKEFVAVMRDWRAFFTSDKPVVGATEEELRRITVPTVIIAGGDDVHPTAVAQKLHELLPQSEYHRPLWTPQERERLLADQSLYREATAEKVGPILLEFLQKHQARAGVRA
ncbi:MAG: alpha/beta fold hydrolase [Chloroflexi bacterium]|nr:alpha/beta fold hydrolase [Chloroflexota bacterium]